MVSVPKMADISKLLKEIGEPGEKQEEKKKAVEDLFIQSRANMTNVQGFSVLDDLHSYPEY